MLCAEHVSKYYTNGRHKIYALKDVSLSLEKGESIAIVGESGSGKSTLAKLLTGITAPDEGDILLKGRSIVPPAREKDKSICAAIQLVLQDGKSALDPRFTVYKSIAEPVENLTSLSKAGIKKKVFSLMERLELGPELEKRRPGQLSGGQQKRVCIARALATEPDYILFDEAVSGLDVLIRKKVLDQVKALHKEREATFVMITHDIEVALYMADRIVVMQKGQITEECRKTGGTFRFAHPYTKLLLEKMQPFS